MISDETTLHFKIYYVDDYFFTGRESPRGTKIITNEIFIKKIISIILMKFYKKFWDFSQKIEHFFEIE